VAEVLRSAMLSLSQALAVFWQQQATRRVLWVPVCFAAGIALYVGLPSEPPRFLLPLLLSLSLVLAYVLRRRALPAALLLVLVFAGATLTQYRSHAHMPTMLHEALTPRLVTGTVRDIERTQTGVRLLLNRVVVDDLASEKTPEQVRLSIKFRKGATFELPRIGDAVALRAGLMPPMGPALPGGFDFARFFYFKDIGAVGYGLPPWEVIARDERPGIAEQFWSWRARLTDRIVLALGSETGGIAAGLITGDGRAISEADFEALRASNLYHIIAISGEHMVIISGVIFVALRLLMLWLPRGFGQRPASKSLAALITLLLVTLYLFVTGLPTSAVRAYVMIALVLLAVILRRYVDPMRSLALAATLMLAYDPAALLDPGFQLSFAATLAIIALVESRLLTLPPGIERGRWRMAWHHLVTLLLVAVVAEAATAPLAIAMFNNFSVYGVLANSLATPLVSLFLMPVVALFFILLPFGLEGVALSLLHYGISALLALAYWIASLPYAQVFVPTLSDAGLALFALGLLWICLWQGRVRRYGIAIVLVGISTIALYQPPDLLVSGNLKQIAFRGDAGMVLARGRSDAMVPEMWAHGLGYKELPRAEVPAWRCDRHGCIARVDAHRVALPIDLVALMEDCQRAKLILSTRTPVVCDSAAQIYAGRALEGAAITAFWIDASGDIRHENSAHWQGNRPWTMQGNADEDED
jgi:competence protein ComEC